VYASYLGGTEHDEAHGVAVDSSGTAYVVGFASSSNLPTTPGAFQTIPGDNAPQLYDAFVAKVLDLTPTPTPIPIPTATSTPSVCTPRPAVGVNVVAAGSGRLQVTISSGTAPATPGNRLLGVRATIPSNAVVDVPNGPQGLTGTVNLPVVTQGQLGAQNVFVVRRTAPGAVHVPLLIIDTCGEWPTFVGGGPNAF